MIQQKSQKMITIHSFFVVMLLMLLLPSWSLSEPPGVDKIDKEKIEKMRQRLAEIRESQGHKPRPTEEDPMVYHERAVEKGVPEWTRFEIIWYGLYGKEIRGDAGIAGVKDYDGRYPSDRGGVPPDGPPTYREVVEAKAISEIIKREEPGLYFNPATGEMLNESEVMRRDDERFVLYEREKTEGEKRMDAFRARAAQQRARRHLKAAQERAQAEKKTADARAARATVEQQSQGCFPRDIRVVMADGTARSIADVKPGDVVMTYDIGYDEIVGKTVTATYSVKSNHLYTVNDDLKTTGGERLLTQSGWKPLIALTKQDLMHVNGRMTGVDMINYRRMELTTYNLQVDDTHNFFVQTESGNAYLVHNCGGGK